MGKWTLEKVETECRKFSDASGRFPTNRELRDAGRNDLACAIVKQGGFLELAEKFGIPRVFSDSDFGWAGEKAFRELAHKRRFDCDPTCGVRAPFDMLIDGVLRADVKTANYAEYGVCRGWFYRMGKMPQADIVILYQMDTGDFYGLPWWDCPQSNVTISRSGGKYLPYKNDWWLIDRMRLVRRAEQSQVNARYDSSPKGQIATPEPSNN